MAKELEGGLCLKGSPLGKKWNGVLRGGALSETLSFTGRDQELMGLLPQEVDVGLAADVGTLQRLPRVIGNQRWVGKPGERDRRASPDLG